MGIAFAGWYVRTEQSPAELAGRAHRAVRPEGSAWVALDWSDSGPAESWDPTATVCARHAAVGETIFLAADTSSDQLVYEHVVDGVIVRKLMWISDGARSQWEHAAGAAEPWELTALFSERALASAVQAIEEEGENGDVDEVRQAFAMRRVIVGTGFPPGDATLMIAIERHFGIVRPTTTR
jgi:hypothetical protein